MASQDDRAETQAGLDSSSSYIRQQLGRQLRLRFIPEIHFEYDASFDYGQKIEKLLSEVRTDEPQDD
jgi:ribosome-binding factor A